MRFKLLLTGLILSGTLSLQQCKEAEKPVKADIGTFFEKYYEERLSYYPMEATMFGNYKYNDKLYPQFTDSYQAKLKDFYSRYLAEAEKIDRSSLTEKDKINYDDFIWEMKINLEGFEYPLNYIPFEQLGGLHLAFAQAGSGSVIQPFVTVKDYDNWLQRMIAFGPLMDSAVVYFKKGLAIKYTLPQPLVKKLIPQMKSMVTEDVTKSVFYQPIINMPKDFPEADKKRLAEAFTKTIGETVLPAYKKMGDFLEKEYLPGARTSSGIWDLPNGSKTYDYMVRLNTSTNESPDSIYNTGLSEVKRIRLQMDSIQKLVAYPGNLKAFFNYLETDKKFRPYTSAEQILDDFEKIHQRMKPQLAKLFTNVPKTPFEIRQIEAFRAKSASSEYVPGTADGKRPGIFYVLILDPKNFSITSGMESLFLHEAIPGHHYQISLQQEDTTMPRFRRFGGQNAYIEGWALYCESLGKELGLYTDPYQYMGALGDEMHRAIRLVVDVGLHAKKMTREEAIQYMTDNEQISEENATIEIERYMSNAGQALGYKIGALKIKSLREKYSTQLGDKFSVAEFHDQVLKDGSLPLEILERKLDDYYKSKK
jgi:uncharacterized protein (DUF885 family)